MKYPALISTLLWIILSWDAMAITNKNPVCMAADTGLKYRLGFPVGAAIKIRPLLNNNRYRAILIREFNSITAENAMKFKALHPSATIFNWSDADQLVDFAVKHQLRIHGHALNWPKNNPKWVMEFQGDSVAWEQLLKKHIQTVVSHFKGKVSSWDVVNEAFNDNGTLRKTIWLQKLGPAYLARCFVYAHEADPAALLFYNDYGQEYNGKKMKAILKWLGGLQREHIPIHGIGFQLHTSLRIPIPELQKSIQAVVRTGLLLHLSELDVSVRSKKGEPLLTAAASATQQAAIYRQIFTIYQTVPARQRFGITLWGIGDQDSYRNAKNADADAPLLFDHNYQPKPAYKAVQTSGH